MSDFYMPSDDQNDLEIAFVIMVKAAMVLVA